MRSDVLWVSSCERSAKTSSIKKKRQIHFTVRAQGITKIEVFGTQVVPRMQM